MNRRRLFEKYATDTLFSSTKAVNGETCCQIFVGCTSNLTYCYGMHSESEGASILLKHIKEVGAPCVLKNDNSKMQTGKKWSEICALFSIGQETTEPYHQHQNEAERRIQTVKNVSNRVMDRSGAPDSLWLMALTFTCMVLNVLASPSLAWRTPMEVGLGITPDTSAFMYPFFCPVYYVDPTPDGYPGIVEKLGHWCGPAEHCGDALTAWIYTPDTENLIARSVTRPAVIEEESTALVPFNYRSFEQSSVNFPADLEGSTVHDSLKNETRLTSLTESLKEVEVSAEDIVIKFDLENLMGFSYAREKDGLTQRCVVKEVDEENERATVEYITGSQDVVDYNEIINQLNAREEDGDGLWSFKSILDHRPLKGKRNQWEVLVDWDHCNSSWEPLAHMRAADQITLANYANEKNITNLQGWKWAKGKDRNPKKFIRMAKILKSQVKDLKARYKFGVLVPRSVKECLMQKMKSMEISCGRNH